MSVKKLIAGFFFLDFAALNVAALWFEGFAGMSEAVAGANLWTLVIAVDLVIALGMVLTWLWRDAKRNDRNPIGYTVLTLATGSLGPLLYIMLGEEGASESSAQTRSQTTDDSKLEPKAA